LIYNTKNIRHTLGGVTEVESPTGEEKECLEEVPGDSRQGLYCHHDGCPYDGHPCVEKRDKSTINSPLVYNTKNIRHTLGGATEVESPTGEEEEESPQEEVPGDSRQGLHCHHGGCSYGGHACVEKRDKSTINSPLIYNTKNSRRTLGGVMKGERATGEGEPGCPYEGYLVMMVKFFSEMQGKCCEYV